VGKWHLSAIKCRRKPFFPQAKLREEITKISEASRLYMQGGKKMPGSVGEHERRLQRLQDILDELVSLTDWKKV
jgi:hypothetical protein